MTASDHSAVATDHGVALSGQQNVAITGRVGGNVTVTIGGPEVRDEELMHTRYLQRLFEQKKWAAVSMNLFDPSFGRRVDLVDIYTTLPVDFALFLRTANGRVQDWWCGRSDQDWDKLAEQESFEMASTGI